jgi:16S rRNA (guanine527-N7)-methyltransferase
MGPDPKRDPKPDPKVDADRARALAVCPVSRETEERLARFVALLRDWQARTNLIARSTLTEVWSRHIADSLQLLDVVPEARRWVDLGSGGGFPGIPLACALAELAGGHVHLVERNAKKAAFLREAVRVTSIPASVHLSNIEDFVERFDGAVDCVTARALAPLNVLIGLVKPLVDRGAKAVLPKGQDIEEELTEATKYWRISYRVLPSRTDHRGRIVVLDHVARNTGTGSGSRPQECPQ